jgi:ferric-dicitrate binding protein FerR (iron transport regulator)
MHSEHSTTVRIDREAAEWLVQIRDVELWRDDRKLPESFLNWLTQSKRHGAAFFDVACTWRQLDVFNKQPLTARPERGTSSAK